MRINPGITEKLKFDKDGLIPVITRDYGTGEVLMLAYASREAVQMSIDTGRMHYWSRSRGELWLKGKVSGHYQDIVSLKTDCDSDTLLATVRQTGCACHTGRFSCFFNEITATNGDFCSNSGDGRDSGAEKADETHPDTAPYTGKGIKGSIGKVLHELYDVVKDRQVNPKEGSYTNYLFLKGLDKILKKVGEEASEVIIASKNRANDEIRYEIADLLYHLTVLMVERGLTLDDISEELISRRH